MLPSFVVDTYKTDKMMNLKDYLSFQKLRGATLRVTHAIQTADLMPRDKRYESWIQFWRDNVPEEIARKYEKIIDGEIVGAHVIDTHGNVYIMPCSQEENSEQGQVGAKLNEKKYFSIPKECLVKVTKQDSLPTAKWNEMITANQPIVEHMQKLSLFAFRYRFRN